MKPAKPIKRSPHIVSLSRDHHHTLLLCWKIKQGIAKSVPPERIAAYADHFNRQFVKDHFRQEETLLFSRLTEKDPYLGRAFEEHKALQFLFGEIALHPSYEKLAKLATDLAHHIRFEERTLFSYVENALPEEQLLQAAAVLNKEQHTAEDNWDDVFWEK
jgi:hemerythrin superfamily protein